jgi:hypothetical protein
MVIAYAKQERKGESMNFKNFKDGAAEALMTECQKVAPELSKSELFWMYIALACLGWLLLGLCTGPLTTGFWVYGLLALFAGCGGALLMYEDPGI